MWTVTVTLPGGGEDVYSDSRRFSPSNRDAAWEYRYEVDETSDVLRVYRRLLLFETSRYGGGIWHAPEESEEIAYYRPHQWDRVRGD